MKKLCYALSILMISIALSGCGFSGCCNNNVSYSNDGCCGSNTFGGNWY